MSHFITASQKSATHPLADGNLALKSRDENTLAISPLGMDRTYISPEGTAFRYPDNTNSEYRESSLVSRSAYVTVGVMVERTLSLLAILARSSSLLPSALPSISSSRAVDPVLVQYGFGSKRFST